MNAYENVEIFEDTKRLCEKNEKLKASVAESVKGQKLIPESEKLPVVDKKRFSDEAKVTVSTKRTFEAAGRFLQEGLQPADSLSRASHHSPHSPEILQTDNCQYRCTA